jgi:hypothetical protein
MGYWRQFFISWGRETYRTWRWELFAAVLVSTAVCIKAYIDNAPNALSDFKTALYANAIVLGGFALWHLIRTPSLLHKETEKRHIDELAIAEEKGKSTQKKLINSLPTREQWMGLADRFRALPYTCANWYTAHGTTTWALSDATVRALCNMAGAMLEESNLIQDQYPVLLSEVDHTFRWLSYIKATKSSVGSLLRGEEDLPDGSKLFSHMGGVEVPKNSADICIEFAARSGGRI